MKYYERIRELREDNDMSQEKLSKLLNIGQQTLSQYESNKRKLPIDLLEKYAEIFNVSIDYIMGRTDNPETNKSTTNIKYQINGGKFNKTTMKWGIKVIIVNEESIVIKELKEVIENITKNAHYLKSECNSNAAKRKYIYLEAENEEEVTVIATITIKKSEMNKKYLEDCRKKNKSPIKRYINETR